MARAGARATRRNELVGSMSKRFSPLCCCGWKNGVASDTFGVGKGKGQLESGGSMSKDLARCAVVDYALTMF